MGDASLFVTLAIPSLAIAVVAFWVVAVARSAPSERRTRTLLLGALLTAGWLGLTGLLAAEGLLVDDGSLPPRPLLVLAPTLLAPVLLGLSSAGRRAAHALPLAVLVGIHAFRLPLELVMHRAASEGAMPVQMSYGGWNFDILSGVSALLLAIAMLRSSPPRWLLIAWNTAATLLLAIIVVIAVSSLPRFHAFGSEPSRLNTWVLRFPFVWLPAGLVASAVFGHTLLWRRILATRD